MTKIDFKLFIILLLVGNLSLINNSLKIASPSWYQIYGWDSEQLVLDGILNSNKNEIFTTSNLGEFTRPNLKKSADLSRKYFEEKNMEGQFKIYTSQYGLQVKVFSFFYKLGINIYTFRTLNSFLLCFIISSTYLILRKSNFNKLGSLSFTVSLLLSPWIIVSSPNLYWVPFTWYLPAFINSLFISFNLIKKKKYFYFLFFLLFLAFLIKFLCGFEYITSVLIYALISSIFIGYKRGIQRGFLFKNIFTLLFAFSLAFILSISLTISNLDKLGYDGFQLMKFTALKRLSINKSDDIFINYCNSRNNKLSFDSCIDFYKNDSDSLKVNRFFIITKYFFVKEFLPWIHSDFSELSSLDKSIIKNNIKNNSSDMQLFSGIKSISRYMKIFIFRLLNLISLPIIIISVFLMSSNKLYDLKILALASSIPLSWFLIANGHSAGHMHINYTLMYMGFIPITFYLFSTNFLKKFYKSNHEEDFK